TSSSFSIASASLADSGHQFRAIFTNTLGSAISNIVKLTVDVPPVITLQPVLLNSVKAGTSVTLKAAASGTPLPTVQWQVSTNGGRTFANIAGATKTALTLTASGAKNGEEFRAVFANPVGQAFTHAVTLTVTKF